MKTATYRALASLNAEKHAPARGLTANAVGGYVWPDGPPGGGKGAAFEWRRILRRADASRTPPQVWVRQDARDRGLVGVGDHRGRHRGTSAIDGGQVKRHVKVKVTREMLVEHGACRGGLKAIARHLPCTLSTDPEQNVDIALVLANSERAHAGKSDAYWTAGVFTRGDAWGEVVDSLVISRRTTFRSDPYTAMQHLAMAADAIAKSEGR